MANEDPTGLGMDQGYLPETAKYLFILDTPAQEEAVR